MGRLLKNFILIMKIYLAIATIILTINMEIKLNGKYLMGNLI